MTNELRGHWNCHLFDGRRAYDVLTDAGQFPVWLPDSRRVLFVEAGKRLIVVDSVTRQARTVFTDARNVIGPPELTRDGRTAYFSRRITASDIWLLTLESEGARPVRID